MTNLRSLPSTPITRGGALEIQKVTVPNSLESHSKKTSMIFDDLQKVGAKMHSLSKETSDPSSFIAMPLPEGQVTRY